MRTNSLFWRAAIATALVWPIWACDNKAGPSPQSQSPQLELKGPATVAPGASAQYTANVRLRDGTRQEVTAQIVWRSSNQDVLGVAIGGLVTGGKAGEVTLTAVYNAITATAPVIVVPPGTYRVTGSVIQADSTSTGVAQALVEVISNGGTVLDTTTDAAGAYRLYGVPGNAQLRVSRDGFLTSTRQLNVSGHTNQNISLIASGSRLDLQGSFTMTIGAPANCNSFGLPSLPSELRQRTYGADVTQTGLDVLVTLRDATFNLNGSAGNRFRGVVGTSNVTFQLTGYDDYYYYPPTYPDVVERLSDGTYFVPWGRVTATTSSSGLSGTLSGGLNRFGAAYPAFTWIGGCYSSSLQFSMTR